MMMNSESVLDRKTDFCVQIKPAKPTLDQGTAKQLMRIENSAFIYQQPMGHLYLLCNCLNWVLFCNKETTTDAKISDRLTTMFDLYCTGTSEQLDIDIFVSFIQKIISHGDVHIREWIRIFRQSQHIYNPLQVNSSDQ